MFASDQANRSVAVRGSEWLARSPVPSLGSLLRKRRRRTEYAQACWLLGIASFFSPIKIRRDADACIDCGKCARACPSNLPVNQLVQIRSVECTACMECVAACPAQDALQFSLVPRKAATSIERWRRRTLRPAAVAVALAIVFFGLVFAAKASGHWQTTLPREIYMDLVSHASKARHPGT